VLGAMMWENNSSLGEKLISSVKNAKAPIFLLQAENDFSLRPSEILGPDLMRKSDGSLAKVYPAFGTTHEKGHAGFAVSQAGTEVWGKDVLSFINEVVK
jgi:hypothetical protein